MSPRKLRLKAFLERVWSQGEVAAVEEFIAEAYTIHNDPGDPWHGQTLTQSGFADRLTTSRAVAPDQVFTVIAMVEEGDQIAATWRWEGTHLGDLPGIPATGKRITMTGATLYTFDADDQLTGHWQIADRMGIYQQLTAS